MLTIREAPKSRTAIAGIYTDDKCTTDTRFVFSREFVEKVQTAIRRFRKAFAVTKETQTHPYTEQVVLLYLQLQEWQVGIGWAPFMEIRM
ncbi:hypothetical protein L915_14316, partial [Phytophthora nicotianae]